MLEISGKKNPSAGVVMEMLSKRYGWLPSEIRSQSLDDITTYIEIIAAQNQLDKMKQK